jgi:hypothetical protein
MVRGRGIAAAMLWAIHNHPYRDASPLQDALTYDSRFLHFDLIILNCPGGVQAKRVGKREC